MAELDPNTVIFNTIYVKSVSMEYPAFAYVRFLKDGEIGFSVLDFPYQRPDFNNCGVFWVKPEDFLLTFKPFEYDEETVEKLLEDLIARNEQLMAGLDIELETENQKFS